MEDSGRQSTLLFSIITGIVLLVVGIFGFLVIRSFNSMEQQIAKNESRNAALAERIDSLSQKIEIVGSIARDAEDQARQAAIGRIRAEASKSISEAETRVALKKAASLEEEVTRSRDEVARIKEERNQEMNRLQAALSRIADTRRTALGLVMNLGSDTINFDFDRANLRTENKELLSRIVGVLLTSNGYRAQIFGHTDDVGSADYNQKLSLKRAESVRDYLVEAGLDPTIITVKGFGKSNPLVEGKSGEARAKNRRVEVGIIDTVVRYDNVVDEGE
jgi:outer membrane protein OmpA-like peptidoglycan-associated protein